MDGNGQVLHWSGRVVTAEDLRRSLNGQSELVLPARAIITPLAADELRANGVRVTRQAGDKELELAARWGYAQERPHQFVHSAIQALKRDGLALKELLPKAEAPPCRWAQAVAMCLARGECRGGVVFCQDPGLICCVANKIAGLRAVAVATVNQGVRATQTLGANLVAIEMPGCTFFEVRQILSTLCLPGEPICPPGVAGTLEGLDGHAHR